MSLKILLGSFQIFSKNHGDICKSRCINGINDTGGKFPSVSTTPAAKNFATGRSGVVDTSGEFATNVKFATTVNDTGG